ncbi:hypothetical protein JKP88DRAFT_284560 [Tribonema minus]|uniref:EF-hand domain-containing protein n=1 Tax=Tribonema minus TaxID=303371 RepID=A0A835ZJU8_9STRA|nr:hypothetical protein JKP88DRAFT_284560 [Tribonema minus]
MVVSEEYSDDEYRDEENEEDEDDERREDAGREDAWQEDETAEDHITIYAAHKPYCKHSEDLVALADELGLQVFVHDVRKTPPPVWVSGTGAALGDAFSESDRLEAACGAEAPSGAFFAISSTILLAQALITSAVSKHVIWDAYIVKIGCAVENLELIDALEVFAESATATQATPHGPRGGLSKLEAAGDTASHLTPGYSALLYDKLLHALHAAPTLSMSQLDAGVPPRLRHRLRALFDTDRDGEVSRRGFAEALDAASDDRDGVLSTVSDYRSMMQMLDRVLTSISCIAILFTLLKLAGTDLLSNALTIVTIILACSFLFGKTAQLLFEGIILAFVRRPFDTGDKGGHMANCGNAGLRHQEYHSL